MLDSVGEAATDQAAGLRRLFSARAARVVAFVSGREACGRTSLLVRTAAALAKAGHGVVIIDENSGAGNVHSVLGLKTRNDLLDLVQGGCPIDRLIQPVAPLLSVMSAGRFATNTFRLDTSAAARLGGALKQLQEGSAFVLIDGAARSGNSHSPLTLAAPHLAVVVAAQGAAITRAYALIKHLAQERGCDGFNIAITKAKTEPEALAIFHNMRHTAREHLGVRLDYLGSTRVPKEDHLAGSLQSRLSLTSELADWFGFLPFAASAVSLTAQ